MIHKQFDKIVCAISTVVILGLVILFLDKKDSIQQLGAFGDFVGGTLSIILGFISIVYIVKEFRRNTRLENLNFKILLITKLSSEIRRAVEGLEFKSPKVVDATIHDLTFKGVDVFSINHDEVIGLLNSPRILRFIDEIYYLISITSDVGITSSQSLELRRLVHLEVGYLLEAFRSMPNQISRYDKLVRDYDNKILKGLYNFLDSGN